MISEAQFLYFTEVLGVEPFSLDIGREDGALAASHSQIIVGVPKLGSSERDLLNKMLSAIQLTNPVIQELKSGELKDILPLAANHILTFFESAELKAPEVNDLGGKKWWRFFSPQMLLTENQQLNTERKKQVWTLLQKFKSEALT